MTTIDEFLDVLGHLPPGTKLHQGRLSMNIKVGDVVIDGVEIYPEYHPNAIKNVCAVYRDVRRHLESTGYEFEAVGR